MPQHLAFAFALVLLIVSCSDAGLSPESTTLPRQPLTLEAGSEANIFQLGAESVIRTTAGDQSGNRVAVGRLDLDDEPWRIELEAEPSWIVGGSVGDTLVYLVVGADGSVTAISIDAGGLSTTELGMMDAAAPPIAVFDDDGYGLVIAPDGASPLTAPAVVDSSIISITLEGEVTVTSETSSVPVAANGLGDSRLAVDERGLVAVLSDPTGEYPHGVVGDRVESATVTIFEPRTGEVVGIAAAPEGTVFEAIAPMWADMDGDGDSELLVTASDAIEGARLVVYDERGEQMASSLSIGRGQRWRNQLGVAVLDGVPTIVDVQTPHIGGIVQWFRLEGEALERVAATSEYSTHRIGSRNLDQGVIVDGDGDGSPDVVVPSQNQQSLAALSLEAGEPQEIRSIELGARLSSNLSTFPTPDGRASLALGLEDGTVLIWR